MSSCDVLETDSDGEKRLTAAAYDRWSRVWNLARYTNQAIYRTALALLDARHRAVIDVGCGTGLMSTTLAHSGRQAAAVDLSAAMIARARRRYGLAADFIEADAEDLPFDDDAFDAVVNLISFHHYPDPQRAVAEFRRVLRRDGRLVLIAFDRGSRYIALAQWMNAWTKRVAGTSWQKTPAEICTMLSAPEFNAWRSGRCPTGSGPSPSSPVGRHVRTALPRSVDHREAGREDYFPIDMP
jgi:ubiquinone/menaquinone biosynthesis C-methylase UbiE